MATTHFDPIGKFLYTKDDMGNYHSYDDNPAIEYLDDSELKIWYKHGLIHRDFLTQMRSDKEHKTKKHAISYNFNKKYASISPPYYTMKLETIYKYYINGIQIL
jgi:hypothetical protein